jgi:hypothetical protein
MNLWYKELRDRYRPSIIKILLIGESPPDPGDRERRFFYSPNLKYDNLYRGVAKAVYGEYVKLQKKPHILRNLQRDGFWLIDACDEPINKLKPGEKSKMIKKSLPRLIEKCSKASPTNGVIICHGRVYGIAAPELRKAGVKVLHDESIPFPLGNKRAEFIKKFRKALDRAGLK